MFSEAIELPLELFYGDANGLVDLTEAELSVAQASGKVANLIARKNAALKEARSKDADRLDVRLLAVRQINGRWYHRMGAYLVDEQFTERPPTVSAARASA